MNTDVMREISPGSMQSTPYARPVRVAVLLDDHISIGGGFQQSLNAALLIQHIEPSLVSPVFFTTHRDNIHILEKFGINAHYLGFSWFERRRLDCRRFLRSFHLTRLIRKSVGLNVLESRLKRHSIDIVYFLSPSFYARDMESLNFIFVLWDLCLRDQPEFPEIRENSNFEIMDCFYSSVLPKATAILVDSSVARQSAVQRYGLDINRIHVMPFSPAARVSAFSDERQDVCLDISIKYQIDCPYVFYPAQFWAHKNHAYLLHGLKLLESIYGVKVGAIFAGADKGNLSYIKRLVISLGLSERVRTTGFVPDDEIPHLYVQSLALVMPTYFGPTNLPPLEAFALGVPVLYSDLPGLRDQVQDAALLLDLQDPSTMAKHIIALIEDHDLRSRLISAGRILLRGFTESQRISVLEDVFKKFYHKRICWE